MPLKRHHEKWDPQNQENIPDEVKNIYEKLRVNETLNPTERRFLIDLLKDCEKSETVQQRQSTVEKRSKESQVYLSSFGSDVKIQTDKEETGIIDSEDLEKLIEEMKGMQVSCCNPDEIKRLMDITYADRRSFIHHSNPDVKDLATKYPLLFSTTEIKNELERIFTVGRCKAFYANLRNYAAFILDEVDTRSEMYIMFHNIKNSLKTKEEEKYAVEVAALLSLGSVFKEKTTFVHFKNEVGQYGASPHIDAGGYSCESAFMGEAQFEIMVENSPICITASFPEAVLCLLACYFIFYVKYENSCYSTLFAFERLLLNLSRAWENEIMPTNSEQFVNRVLENYDKYYKRDYQFSVK